MGLGIRSPEEPAEIAEQAGLNAESIAFRFEPYFAISPEFLEMRALSVLQPPSSVNVTAKHTHLLISGEAPHRWIRRLDDLSPVIPGVTKVVTERLIDTDMKRFGALRERLESTHLYFEKGSSQIPHAVTTDLSTISQIIRELDDMAGTTEQHIRIENTWTN